MTPYLTGLGTIEGIATLSALLLIGCYVTLIASRLVRDRRILLAMAACAFLDLLIFAALFASSGYLNNDAQLWHTLGALAADSLSGDMGAQGSSSLQKDGKEGYIWILGALYYFGGATPTLGIGLNLIARVATVILVARATQDLMDASGAEAPRSAGTSLVAAFLAAVLPAFAIWSPQLLRESLTVFFIAWAMTCAVAFLRHNQIRFIFLFLIPIALLAWIRQTLGVSVGIALVAGTAFAAIGQNQYGRVLRILAVIMGIPLVPLLLNAILSVIGIDEERIIGSTSELSDTASSGFPGLGDNASVAQVLLVTVPRVVAGPFIWEITPSAVMILAAAELVCWIAVVVFAMLSLGQFRSTGALHTGSWMMPVFAVTAVALVLGLSLIVGNYGLLARFRPTATVTLLPLAAIGITSAVSAAHDRRIIRRA